MRNKQSIDEKYQKEVETLQVKCKHKKTTTWTHSNGATSIDCDKCGKIIKKTWQNKVAG